MRFLATLSAVFLGACGDPRPGPEVQEPLAPPGLEVPRVSLWGAVPPAAGRVTVDLGLDGALHVNGAAATFDELVDHLDRASRPPGWVPDDPEEVEETEILEEEIVEEGDPLPAREPMVDPPPSLADALASLRPGPRPSEPLTPGLGVRNADVLLRVDHRAPWGLAVRLLTGLVDERVALERAFFAVQGGPGGEPGALAVFLPRDAPCGPWKEARIDLRSVRLAAMPEAPPRTAEALARELLSRLERAEQVLAVSLRLPSDAPFSVAIQGLEAAFLAGAQNLTFRAPEYTAQPEDPAALIARTLPAAAFGWRLTAPAPARPPPRALAPLGPRSGYFGTTNDPLLLGLPGTPEEDELAEEPEDDPAPRDD